MYVEQRIYSLVPGGPAQYLKAYNGRPRQRQTQILGRLIGVYQTESGELNQVVFLWGFDSLDERVRRRRQLMEDPEFAQFRQDTRHLLLKQESRMLSEV
jgi:hypothetical protein